MCYTCGNFSHDALVADNILTNMAKGHLADGDLSIWIQPTLGDMFGQVDDYFIEDLTDVLGEIDITVTQVKRRKHADVVVRRADLSWKENENVQATVVRNEEKGTSKVLFNNKRDYFQTRNMSRYLLTHEFGHVLGLKHPWQHTPEETTAVDGLTPDDTIMAYPDWDYITGERFHPFREMDVTTIHELHG